jgi:hypothetical protein
VEKDEGVRLTAGLLQLSQGSEERLRRASRAVAETAVATLPLTPRSDSPQELRERRLLALAVALPEAAARYLDSLGPEAFEVEEHRAAFARLRAGERDPDAWPAELEPLAARLRVEIAEGADEAELRELALRIELQMLERRAARMRMAGDESERLRALELLGKVRAALRGGE